MSKQAFQFEFEIGPLKYQDAVPWQVWGKVPKTHRQSVLREYRNALEAFMKHHIPQCRNCCQGWFDPFGNRCKEPCHIFNMLGSAIRRMWHAKLTRSLQIMAGKHKVERAIR